MPGPPDARIEELDFSVRTYNCLKKANVLTIGELVQLSEADLMNIRNFGKKSLNEVKDKLASLNLVAARRRASAANSRFSRRRTSMTRNSRKKSTRKARSRGLKTKPRKPRPKRPKPSPTKQPKKS